jgi:hypothetical protein
MSNPAAAGLSVSALWSWFVSVMRASIRPTIVLLISRPVLESLTGDQGILEVIGVLLVATSGLLVIV